MVGPHQLGCEAPAAHARAQPVSAGAHWVLPATILGSSLTFIDSSVVNVALPVIRQHLQASLATMQWVVNAYMLALASLILLGGSAADRFGRRRVFLAGLVTFAAASLTCGLAPSARFLIAARLVQGAGAAFLTPASLAIIGSAFSGNARGRAIGTWAAAGALTTSLGPSLGGWLTDAFGWRTIFFINLPIGAAAFVMALELQLPRDSGSDEPLDLRGSVLAIVALGAWSSALIAFGEGSTGRGLMALAVAAPASWMFVETERHSAAPMMPLALFRDRDFAGANALTVLLYAALSGALFVLPFVLIEAHGYSTIAAGASFLPFSAIMAAGSRWSGALAGRIGSRPQLIVGPLVSGVGFVILGLSGSSSSYWTGFLPGLVVVAVGMTLTVAPLTTTVLDAAPRERSGTASGINSAAARSGGLLAIAAIGLAFGSAAGQRLAPSALLSGYRWVMLTAAALAALSAGTAFGSLSARRRQ